MQSYVDTHCDTIVKLYRDGQYLRRNKKHIDLERLSKYTGSVQIFALWLEPWYYETAWKQTMKYLQFYQQQLKENGDLIQPVYCYEDIVRNKKNRKLSAVLSLEGGEALEGSLENLRFFYRLGVRMLSLTWNYKNTLAYGVGEAENRGLTPIGRAVVKEMEQLGMMVDVSHLSDKGFYEVAELMKQPFLASHSNAREICNHKRNLTDEQLHIIREKQGYVGLNFYPLFVANKKTVHSDDLVRQLLHLLSHAGENCVGFGTDFDGIETTPQNVQQVADMQNIFEILERELGKELFQKVREENFLRMAKMIWV